MTAPVTTAEPKAPERRQARPLNAWQVGLVALMVVTVTRWITEQDDLTSPGTFGVMVRTAAPIALAGLAGLFAERSGTINIGLEGMMVMGTIFAGWWGWEFGPWMAIVGGVIGGMLGGLLHAVATATFGVNHIVSGFAINIIAPGVARFMANLLFVDEPGGSITNSPGNAGKIGEFTVPFLSGGELIGWKTPDLFGWIDRHKLGPLTDLAGLGKGLTSNLSLDILLTLVLFIASVYVLWHTPFGLRLRSAGERPSAADSLGVHVLRYRYYGMLISGGLAGFGGAVMVLFANRYQQDQTGGRGFLGLATLVVGNWRPGGVAGGAGLFGYFQGITLRTNPERLVLALVLAAAIVLALAAAYALWQRRWTVFLVTLVLAAGGFVAYVLADRPSNQFVYITPYLVTLVVVSVRGQASRPPAQEGIPWRKGMQI